jgi:hypothetical protein
MNTTVELPSAKIFNIARFIALLPASNITDSAYHLILEGYPTPINLELSDAQTLKKILELDKDKIVSTNQSVWDEDKQLVKNKRAIELLAERIERHKNMSETESMQRKELFDEFKEIVDAQRLPGQKLYSDS